MSFRERLLRNPQSLLPRKALFQIHLWTGIGVGLYVLMISVSGSLLVYRPELFRAFSHEPPIVAGSGSRLTQEELRRAALQAYPEYRVTQVWKRRNPDQAVEIWLEHGEKRKQRLFHPYTGADLGNALHAGFRFTSWVLDLHDDLLTGHTGRLINGIGAIFVTLLGLTGAIIWWPGARNWRRGLTIDWQANWKRFNWDLHSALGFWFFAFVLLWAISGIYLAFPGPFNALVDYLEPIGAVSRAPRHGDVVLFWLARLHFGRFAGRTGRVLWTVFGLVPATLFVTGALMWWNRMIRRGA